MNNSVEIKKIFIKLLDSKSLDSINVSLICDELNIKRQTFYYHYRDIYDLGDSILQDYTDDLLSSVVDKYYLNKIIEFINDNLNVFYSFVNFGLKDLVLKFLNNLLMPYVNNSILNADNVNYLNNKDITEIMNYHTNAISLYLLELLKQYETLNIDHTLNKIEIFLDNEILSRTAKLYFEKRKEI